MALSLSGVVLEDYILKPDADLVQLAKDLREGVPKIFPKGFDEIMFSNNGHKEDCGYKTQHDRTKKNESSFDALIESIAGLWKNGSQWVLDDVLSWEFYERGPKRGDQKYFSIDIISGRVLTCTRHEDVGAIPLTPEQTSELYRIMEKYIELAEQATK